jgi:hypothetical protein
MCQVVCIKKLRKKRDEKGAQKPIGRCEIEKKLVMVVKLISEIKSLKDANSRN